MQSDICIGDLRWQVTLATRLDSTDPFNVDNSDVTTTYANPTMVFAKITPVGTQTYLQGQQLEIGAVTHRMTIRWRPILTTADVVLRTRTTPDGDTYQEVYAIHRMTEWEGRQRFLILDVELEKNA